MGQFDKTRRSVSLSSLPDISKRRSSSFGIVNYTFVIPVFSEAAGSWLGASIITIEFPGVAPRPFSFIAVKSRPVSATFCLAVKSGNLRFKFWEGVGELLYVPIYNGEIISEDNFTIEVWSVQGQATTVSVSPIELVISSRRFVNAGDSSTEDLGIGSSLSGAE